MAATYGVDNPVPPWKTSLDGICDALDQSSCGPAVLNFVDRRDEEDALSATLYADLPYPENRLIALAHSLVVRGLIDEVELEERMAAVRARLES
ncbi:thiocyanate hydrolase [Mycobacterium sp. 852002-40037_SCH5390672]|uniref:thiocyanate hydrolase n=1 Tax=Mycobacterium sp. 852002-40037_SCH5390672 TaxID=1834089 RepID=UPI001E41F1E5|nr:thiocyanate hydrolase [Mycobacterium sp. 852002-40037_SCH5390672]